MKSVVQLSLLPVVLALPPLPLSTIQAILSAGPAPITDPRFKTFVPPGPNDVRSPCPGLNTLANHGFLPHSGKNITIPQTITGLANGLNIGVDFSTIVGAAALLASPDPFAGMFDLNQLDQHNFPIEHDVSMSRADAYTGNDYSFNQTLWDQVLSYYAGHAQTSYQTSSNARYDRVENSSRNNPEFTYGPQQFLFSYGESGLYTQTMSNPNSNGVANVSFIRSLFEKQQLPVALGWTPSPQPITFMTLGSFIVQLYTAQPPSKFIPEGIQVLESSYRDAFSQLVGGSHVLANLTQGISNYI